MSPHQYDLGLIGNCHYSALINSHADVQWLCWPRFDSPYVFGGLLDQKNGGSFLITPSQEYETNQYYIENTNVLQTVFETEESCFQVTDFAPRFEQFERYFKPLMLIRKLEPVWGYPKIKVSIDPVRDYGKKRAQPLRGSNHISFEGYDEEVRLTTNISLNYILNQREFVLSQPRYLVLTWGQPLEEPLESTVESFLKKTIDYWRSWVKNCSVIDFHQKEVIRSALTLKLHQFEDTGAIIAATTTSLPEHPGTGRNWDYRFCWLRDTYYILSAFNNISHFEEMQQYSHFIENIAMSGEGHYAPVYSILGDKDLPEQILDLPGYQNDPPVRIGNHAYTHIQNDVYGEILVSLLPFYTDDRFISEERTLSPHLMHQILDAMEGVLDEPDAGLWEFRATNQRHCFSYLFHWAGSSAAMKIALKLESPHMYQQAQRICERAKAGIEACYDSQRGVYTQAVESSYLDASLLQLITMKYLDPETERAKSHLRVLEGALKSKDGLFFRYQHEDDFGKPQSTFLVCAYWYIEALAAVGRLDEAQSVFKNIQKYRNHLGLLSEDVESQTGSQWGNFPQAYSHMGLINAAFIIAKKLDRPNFL